MKAQAASLRGQMEEYAKACADLGPTVEASVGMSSTSARVDQGVFLGQKLRSSYDEVGTNSSQISINQVLFSAGRVTSKINAAQSDFLSGRQQLRVAEESFVANLVTAYADVILSRQLVDVGQRSVDELAIELHEIQTKYDAGAAAVVDLAQVKARLIQAKAALNNSQGQLAAAIEAYTSATGKAPSDLQAADLQLPVASMPDALAWGAENNPQVLAAYYDERSASAKLEGAKSEVGPTVSATASYGRSPQADFRPLYEQSATIGVTAHWTLFSSGSVSAAIRQAKDVEDAAKYQLEDARKGMKSNVTTAWQNLKMADAAIDLARHQASEEQVAYDSSQQQYKAGLIPTINLLNAEQEKRDAESAVAKAEHDEVLVKATLLRAMGGLEISQLAPDAVGELDVPAVTALGVFTSGPWGKILRSLNIISPQDK